MKNITILLAITIITLSSCEKNSAKGIFYEQKNQSIEVKRTMDEIKSSDDEISKHIDSIVTGKIQAQIISTGVQAVTLNDSIKIGFEIIDLNLFNPQGIPESLDSLAIRVIPKSVEILDNSSYGYPDALEVGQSIDENGNWVSNSAVLATLGPGGNFYNKKEKFLAFRYSADSGFHYGWIKLSCSDNNHLLQIHDYAYQLSIDEMILSGQSSIEE